MPIIPNNIFESTKVVEYLKSRNLLKQYQKAKKLILQGHSSKVRLGKLEPKRARVWYFRVNKQYRAKAYYQQGDLRIYMIDDHQN
jgi:plasmid maintenance system killer protein